MPGTLKLKSDAGGSISLAANTTAATDLTVTVPVGSGTMMVSPQLLTVPSATGTVMVSGNMPAFSAYSSVGNSISNSTFTKLTTDTTRFDTNTNYATSTFTPKVAGYYQINATISSAGSATGYFQLNLYKNGSAYFGGPAIPNSTIGPNISASSIIYCNGSTDYIEIYATQTTGGAYTLTIKDFNGSLVRSA